MSEKTKPISIRLTEAEVEQLQARAHTLSANITAVARDLIRTGLVDGDNKALAALIIGSDQTKSYSCSLVSLMARSPLVNMTAFPFALHLFDV